MSVTKNKNYHWYSYINGANIPNNGNVSVYVNCPFAAKEVRINFAYHIIADGPAFYTVSTDMCQQNIIGSLNNYQGRDTLVRDITSDVFRTTNQFNYIFINPAVINSNYSFNFKEEIAGITYTSRIFYIHFEFIQ